MDIQTFFVNYWPLVVLVAWFGYRWWSARRVAALLPALRARHAVIVDVRTAGEFAAASAPGTVNIPLSEFGKRLSEIPRTGPVVVACATGTRSGMAKLMLKKNGYAEVHNIGAWTKLL